MVHYHYNKKKDELFKAEQEIRTFYEHLHHANECLVEVESVLNLVLMSNKNLAKEK